MTAMQACTWGNCPLETSLGPVSGLLVGTIVAVPYRVLLQSYTLPPGSNNPNN